MRIARYLLWRVVRGVVTLLIMIALTFAMYFAIETNPPAQFFFPAVGRGTAATPQQLALINHAFYLDRSKVGLYFGYLGKLLHGNFGREVTIDSQKMKVLDAGPVGHVYTAALRATLSILLGGALFVLLLSIPLGAIAGSRIGSIRDNVISFGALLLVCTHPMMLGLILRSAFGNISWLPTIGYCPLIGHAPKPVSLGGGFVTAGTSSCGGPVDWASHMALPWLTFALLFLALYTRMVRASVAETITEDFVRTARAKGASQRRILARHVVPSAGLRVLTMVGMEIGTAIGVCIYLESVFAIPGLGSAAVRVLGGTQPFLDLYSCLAIVVLITLVVIIGNLVVDMLYVVLDPRVSSAREGGRTKSLVGGVF